METTPLLQLSYEPHEWAVSEELAHRLGAIESRRLSRTYNAAVPVQISNLDLLPLVTPEAREIAAVATAEIVTFDSEMARLPMPMPAILLRTESASSSKIENLTAGARRIAAATLGVDDHDNAQLIAANMAAMRAALAHPQVDSPADILIVHQAILGSTRPDIAGTFRSQQVWIGGSSLSPHAAAFIPPHHERLPELLKDVVKFINRRDLPPLIHSALAHAQFETIHPFEDGNGRVGRVLIHTMLTKRVPLFSSTIPVSAGLLVDPQGYFSALTKFRDGDPSEIVSTVSHGALSAISNGRALARELSEISEEWAASVKARSDSTAWRALELLLTQPVVNAEYLARSLEISDRGARNAIGVLEAAGVLRQTHTRQERRRNVIWQADAVLTAMDAFAARAGRRVPGV